MCLTVKSKQNNFNNKILTYSKFLFQKKSQSKENCAVYLRLVPFYNKISGSLKC